MDGCNILLYLLLANSPSRHMHRAEEDNEKKTKQDDDAQAPQAHMQQRTIHWVPAHDAQLNNGQPLLKQPPAQIDNLALRLWYSVQNQ